MELKYADTSEVLAAMRMGVEYTFQIAVRGFSVSVRPISVSETLEVAGEVTRALSLDKRSPEAMNTHQAYLIALFTLQKACKPIGSKVEGPLQKSTVDQFTVAELLALFEQYRDGAERVNPSIEEIPIERVKELVEHTKKNPEVLTQLSRRPLETLARYLLTNHDTPTDK